MQKKIDLFKNTTYKRKLILLFSFSFFVVLALFLSTQVKASVGSCDISADCNGSTPPYYHYTYSRSSDGATWQYNVSNTSGMNLTFSASTAGSGTGASSAGITWTIKLLRNGGVDCQKSATAPDCSTPVNPVCGNRVCEAGETYSNCPGDCPDTSPPSVSITSPTNNSTVSGTVTLSANAADPQSGISQVRFLVQNNTTGESTDICTDTSFPYSCSWDTTSFADGGYRVYAEATNGVGLKWNRYINVTVNNGGVCADDCSPSGKKQCVTEGGTTYKTCGNYDADSCLEWSGPTTCSSGQTCSGGSCGGVTCDCTWISQGCGGTSGGVTCPSSQRRQTKSCPATGCQVETGCLADSVCAASIPSPSSLISPIGDASNIGNCVSEGAEVTFTWTPANPAGQTVQEQWLDLTTNNGIFTTPCTSNTPPYSPTGCFVHVQLNNWQNSYIAKAGNPLGSLKPGIKHWWRINTKIGGEWYPSKNVETFTTNSCGTLNCPSSYGRCEVPTMGWCSPETLSQYFHNYVCQASAICYQESKGVPWVESDKGARGLFQIMPDTAASNGIDYNRLCNPNNRSCDPVYDIQAAVKITEDGTWWGPWAGSGNPVGWCPITF